MLRDATVPCDLLGDYMTVDNAASLQPAARKSCPMRGSARIAAALF